MSAPVSDAEHADRIARVLSVACPKCGAPSLSRCESPSGKRQDQHAARWDAWYAAHPEASAPAQADVSRWISKLWPEETTS